MAITPQLTSENRRSRRIERGHGDSGSEGEDNQRTQAASTTDGGSEGEHYRIRRPGPNRGDTEARTEKGRKGETSVLFFLKI